jgi:hypothetical protein
MATLTEKGLNSDEYVEWTPKNVAAFSALCGLMQNPPLHMMRKTLLREGHQLYAHICGLIHKLGIRRITTKRQRTQCGPALSRASDTSTGASLLDMLSTPGVVPLRAVTHTFGDQAGTHE